tara:strand:+ start:455 stop:688 length:234 start_codon:yes stop_codon:yes gene_type:complete
MGVVRKVDFKRIDRVDLEIDASLQDPNSAISMALEDAKGCADVEFYVPTHEVPTPTVLVAKFQGSNNAEQTPDRVVE